MTDKTEQPPMTPAAIAQRALELKRKSEAAANPTFKTGRKHSELAAAARSMSKSKPWMKK